MGQDPAAIRQQIEETRERMGETVDALGYKANVPARAKESVRDTFAGVRERIVGTGEEVTDRVSGAGTALAERTPDREDVKQAGRRAVGVAQSNPLGLAIGAAAVGFLAGMLIPSTPVEDEHLGPVADQVKRQARETGHDAVQHGREIASETASVAAAKAQEVAGELKDQAQDAAASVAQSAQDAAAEVKDTASDAAADHAEDLSDSARESAATVQRTAAQNVPNPTSSTR